VYKLILFILNSILFASCINHSSPSLQKERILEEAVPLAISIYEQHEKTGSYFAFSGMDKKTLETIASNGPASVMVQKYIFDYRSWYYNGEKDNFYFIAITKVGGYRYGVLKINNAGIYWSDFFADDSLIATKVNPNEISKMIYKYYDANNRKNGHAILERIK